MDEVVSEDGARLDVFPELEVLKGVSDVPPGKADRSQGMDATSRFERHDEAGPKGLVSSQDMVHRLA